jgi:hypothetical protein
MSMVGDVLIRIDGHSTEFQSRYSARRNYLDPVCLDKRAARLLASRWVRVEG